MKLKKKKIFALVKNFTCINEDVKLFKTAKDAKQAFKQYTGFSHNDNYLFNDNEGYSEKYSETKIYEIDLPDFLEIKKSKSSTGE